MTKEREGQEVSAGIVDDGQGTARERRFLLGLGADVEALAEGLRWLPDRLPYVYNIQARAGVSDEQDVLLLVKGVGEEGPEIAFHTGRTMVEALLSYPARLRAGKVKFKPDDFPPSNYEEIAAYVNRTVEHSRATWWRRTQSAE